MWALSEEHRKSRKRDIGHRVACVFSLADIGQSTGDITKAPDDFFEDVALHAPRDAQMA